MKIHLLAASLCFISVASAQESPGETQSIRCSALSHIHTVITSPIVFNELMAQSAMFYASVYTAFREERTGSSGNNGEISGRRDTIEAELRKTWQSRPEVVVNEMALCNTWRADYAQRIPAFILGTRTKAPTAQSFIQLVGVPPTFPTAGQVEKWHPFVATAFATWAETGSQTGGEASNTLRKKLQDSLIKH